MTAIDVEFGDRLRALRVANGLTIRELANKLGFESASALYAYENQQRSPTIRSASQAAQGLGYTLVEFLTACLRCGDRPTPQTCPECGKA